MSLSLKQIGQHPTPYYYYDMSLLRQTLATIKEAISPTPNYHVHYAVKANANPLLTSEIARQGFGADCVSGGEVQACLDAGFAPQDIVFAGVGKADWEIALGLDNDIFCFNVESMPELEVINELAAERNKTARVAFRINPNIDAHTHEKITTGLNENKFGLAMEDMLPAIQRANTLNNVEYIGLHFHIGSQVLNPDFFTPLCHRINELQVQLEAEGIATHNINVGGGLGIDYENPNEHPIPDFEGYFSIFRTHLKLRPHQHLHFELGRSIVGQCGSLITKVLYMKQGHEKKFLITDAGFTELIRPALYDAKHFIENLSATTAETTVYDVVGPICESSDVFDKGVTLPLSHRGDILALRSAGAYGEVMASTYNCRSLVKGYTE